jgi:PAS domain S-box-containing protein
MTLFGFLADKPKPLALSDSRSIVPPRNRLHRFYSLYRLLALMAFVAVIVTLIFDYQARQIENDSNANSRTWSIRLSDVSQLNELVAAISKSSFDLLETAKQETALAEMNADMSLTASRLTAFRSQLLNDMAQSQTAELMARLTEAQKGIGNMSDRVRQLSALSGSSSHFGTKQMGMLQNSEGAVHSSLARLREEMALIENEQFEKARDEEQSLRKIERVIGLFLILMVASTSLYGLRIARQAQANATQKDEYLERLKISEDRFRTMAENMREVFWMTDASMSKVLYVSPAYERICGQTCENRYADAASFISIVHPDDRERARQVFLKNHPIDENPKDAAFVIEYRIVRSDGSIRWIIDRGFPIFDDGGRLCNMVGCSRDITERINAEEALRESETRYKGLVESAFDGVLVHRGGIVETANQSFGSMCGYSVEEMTGKPLMNIVAPEAWKEVQSQIEKSIETPYESVALTKDGTRINIEVAGKKCLFHGKQARITAVRNISERKEAERMKSEFVSFVTHQLRTPLAGIKWMLELAADETSAPDEIKDCVRDARASADRLIRLVNELLNISRVEQGKLALEPRDVDLWKLTSGVLAEMTPLIRERGHIVSLESGAGVSAVFADPELVRQVVLNFISNAVKYTQPGGTISIRMLREGGSVGWEIKDTGIGIPQEAKAKMFQKFYRAGNAHSIETEGMGLGLYFVRLIVEKMGGNVSFESEEGQGSTFYFTLPLAA